MPYKDPKKEKQRQQLRRQTEKYKQYQKQYQQTWREKNKDKWKGIQRKNALSASRKDYLSQWWKTSPKSKQIRSKFNKSQKSFDYQRRWRMQNPEKLITRHQKYYHTLKGTLNRLKKNEARKFIGQKSNLTIELIESVNTRDKNCVYCDKELTNNVHYDHLNPFRPFSETNIVRCCGSCNQQKANADVLQWCKFKGYTPAKIIHELLKKQAV